MIIVGKFSCGCPATEDDGEGNDVSLKTQGIDEDGWKNVIHYATYCDECYEQAVESGCVATTEEEEMTWLMGVDV